MTDKALIVGQTLAGASGQDPRGFAQFVNLTASTMTGLGTYVDSTATIFTHCTVDDNGQYGYAVGVGSGISCVRQFDLSGYFLVEEYNFSGANGSGSNAGLTQVKVMPDGNNFFTYDAAQNQVWLWDTSEFAGGNTAPTIYSDISDFSGVFAVLLGATPTDALIAVGGLNSISLTHINLSTSGVTADEPVITNSGTLSGLRYLAEFDYIKNDDMLVYQPDGDTYDAFLPVSVGILGITGVSGSVTLTGSLGLLKWNIDGDNIQYYHAISGERSEWGPGCAFDGRGQDSKVFFPTTTEKGSMLEFDPNTSQFSGIHIGVSGYPSGHYINVASDDPNNVLWAYNSTSGNQSVVRLNRDTLAQQTQTIDYNTSIGRYLKELPGENSWAAMLGFNIGTTNSGAMNPGIIRIKAFSNVSTMSLTGFNSVNSMDLYAN